MRWTADTVVVGAGSAGCVIAARATEDSSREVLLVEAGPDYPERLPADINNGRRNSFRDHDWGLYHRPTDDQSLFVFPRGRVVGGSSAVNTCIAIRGQRYDYDEWAALGLDGWSYDECLPAFKRLESDQDFGDPWHGTDGPIPIRRHPAEEWTIWQSAFVDAARDQGFADCADHSEPESLGVGAHAMNKIDGERMSAARCYLTPSVRKRPNLQVLSRALARRVLFQHGRVVGLEVEVDGEVGEVRSPRVILSAGAIHTPGILLRSGIGPRAEVARLQVELVADVPAVGERLLDHPGAALILMPKRPIVDLDDPVIQTVARYTAAGSEYPGDMQLQPGSVFTMPDGSFPMVSLMCCVGKPKGTGTIRFRSADPHAPPHIDSKFLLHPEDHRMAVEAMELLWLLATSKHMRDLAYFFWPGERVFHSRESIGEWIFKSCGSGYHPSGTVPMGVNGTGAVDARGRVRGVAGLLVADASIMPTIPSANTNLATLMIGERFGAWLREGELD
ncbi:MAG: GMC family oxidoreductase N-terminal domain-containing protein [Myxococcota bacterium]